MQAQHLLETFTAAGLSAYLTPNYGLKMTSAKAMTDELHSSIKTHKAALVNYLLHTAANDLREAERELIEEKAAIM